VLAPTGTIGFMMDCDTTGIEPDLALIKFKKLVGGGMIKIVNNTVPAALFKLGYSQEQTDAIVSYIDATGTIEGAPQVKEDHLAVFDCSFKPHARHAHHSLPRPSQDDGRRSRSSPEPFPKTVNMPESATSKTSWKLICRLGSWG
jgi:ribonucleoside-diphosphate reductase alpha chain